MIKRFMENGKGTVKSTIAAGMVLYMCLVTAFPLAAGEFDPLLQAGDLRISRRSFSLVYSIISGKTADPMELDRKVEEQLKRARQRLIFAFAAREEGFLKDPMVVSPLDEYKHRHLVDLYIQEKVVEAARLLAEKGASDNPEADKEWIYRREKERLLKDLVERSRNRVEIELNRESLEDGVIGKRKNPVVARIDDHEVRLESLKESMDIVAHPSVYKKTDVEIAEIVLQNYLSDYSLFLAAGEEGFAGAPDYLDDVHRETIRLLSQAYIRKSIYGILEVAEEEIENYYSLHREEFRRAREREIYEILVKDPDTAEKVITELQTGRSFEELVKEYSVGPTRENGGFIGHLQEGEVIPQLDSSIRNMSSGEVSGIIETQFGFHILKCAGETEGRIQTIEEAADKIRTALMKDLKPAAVEERYRELEKRVEVEFNEEMLMEIRERP